VKMNSDIQPLSDRQRDKVQAWIDVQNPLRDAPLTAIFDFLTWCSKKDSTVELAENDVEGVDQ